MEATPSEKRTICEIIGSNFTANAKKIDITLYSVFYDIIEMNRMANSENARFELAEIQSGIKKETSKKAPNLNGGINAHRFELFKKYYEHLKSIQATNICNLIGKLEFAI